MKVKDYIIKLISNDIISSHRYEIFNDIIKTRQEEIKTDIVNANNFDYFINLKKEYERLDNLKGYLFSLKNNLDENIDEENL